MLKLEIKLTLKCDNHVLFLLISQQNLTFDLQFKFSIYVNSFNCTIFLLLLNVLSPDTNHFGI